MNAAFRNLRFAVLQWGIFLLSGLVAAPIALAQAYPTKLLRMIVPHPAGASTDSHGRGIAQFLGQSLGQPVIVDNRAGADGMIGGEACARSAPDGYTICVTEFNSTGLNQAIRSKMAYSPQRDFSLVAHTGFFVAALAVSSTVNANSLGELLGLARSKPDSIAWGTAGPSSSAHLYAEWFRNSMGVAFYNVPYKGPLDTIKAALSGEVQLAVGPASVPAPFVKEGRLRFLAMLGDRRSRVFPDVPSFAEVGVNLHTRNWLGVFAPSGVPAEILQRLNLEIAKPLGDEQFRAKLLTPFGLEPGDPTGARIDALAAFVSLEYERARQLASIARVRLD